MNATLERYRTEVQDLPEYEDTWFPEALTLARQGDEEARRRILGSGLKTALRIAEENRGEDDSDVFDVIQEANYGLTQALRSFQGNTAAEFLDHAAETIRIRLQGHSTKA